MVDVLCFELEFSNVLIKSFVWHICHEDIFSATPRTVWPRRYLGRDWSSWISECELCAKCTVIALPLPGLNSM